MVWEGLNLATSRVPSARRIWMEVVGWAGSSGIVGGANEEVGGAEGGVATADEWAATAGAILCIEEVKKTKSIKAG